ncbi:MAG: glycosyltransferase family 9 protein [Ghiorsea sp.]|nr:glycosyltransferase family 9 protein [Ghiorsea sp.]
MNILIVRNDKLGDFITALPACYILKQHLPDCRITVLISPINQSIAEACDFIDDVIVDTGQSSTQLAKILKQHHFDLSFTLFSNTRVALAQFLARIPRRIAPATKVAQVFYNKRITQRRSQVKMAEFEYNMALIQSAFPDMDTNYPQPLLQLAKNDALTQEGKHIITFHCGFGGSSDANWTVSEYIELAKSIVDIANIQILFAFGPGDEAFLAEFEKNKGELNAQTYVSKASVADFSALIASFSLFISTSTGTFHLASAVGTPTMTFFADSLFASSQRWKGIGDESLQHNYMLPQGKKERQDMFETVKNDLKELVQKLTA